ncbi:MAG: hypothetical protein QE263_04630 [Vampirovibrionales bacterium]|nr:hypothetical protein [Vampirovibrionales bacterium]
MASGNAVGVDQANFGLDLTAPAESGARSQSSQAGVVAPFGAFNVTGGGKFSSLNSSTSGGWGIRPMAIDAATTPGAAVKPSFFSDPFNVTLLALGGVGLWLLLKK